jgi:hypothetical protein
MSDENISVESTEPTIESTEESTVEESQENSQELSSEESSEESGVQAETAEELQAEVEQAIEDGASEEEVKEMLREYTLKVNGKEYLRKIDLSNDDELQKELQMALAGRQAMQKLAESERAHKSDLERWTKNPKAGLSELGIDPVQFAAQVIEDYLAESAKSPEEIEAEKRASEFQRIREENERLKKEAEERVRQAEMAKVEKELENDILSALDGDPELPSSPEVIAKVADNMLWAMQNGWEDVTAADVLPTVKQELQNQFRSIAGSLKSNAALKALLGDDILNNLREERVQQAKQQVNTISNIKQSSVPEKKEEKPKKKVSLKDFMGM